MIVIIGGGMVGLILAKALAQYNMPVTVIESKPPLLDWPSNSLDARVSAINLISQRILANLGVWQELPLTHITPLRGLQVWDHTGGGEISFDSSEIGAAELGYIVENRAIIKILWQQLQTLSNVTLACPMQPIQITRYPDHLELQCADDTIIKAQLIIGADGSHSWVREQMQVETRKHSYQQDAIIAVVKSDKVHQHIGWQSFLPTGPLGVLPLADPYLTAIVWSNTHMTAQRLLQLKAEDFNNELSHALNHRLGNMTMVTEPKLFPLIMRHAKDYVQQGFALIGDAAHTIHPLAGQGVNLGIMDAICLAQVLQEAQKKAQNIASLRVLSRYQRWRKSDNLIMLNAMTGFKELFALKSPWLVMLRSHGLSITNQLNSVKNIFMRYATGQQGDLPKLAERLSL